MIRKSYSFWLIDRLMCGFPFRVHSEAILEQSIANGLHPLDILHVIWQLKLQALSDFTTKQYDILGGVVPSILGLDKAKEWRRAIPQIYLHFDCPEQNPQLVEVDHGDAHYDQVEERHLPDQQRTVQIQTHANER